VPTTPNLSPTPTDHHAALLAELQRVTEAANAWTVIPWGYVVGPFVVAAGLVALILAGGC